MPLTRIQSLGITDGTIVNADINASAAIAGTKLSGAGKVLQVVSTVKSDTFTVASATFTDLTGMSVSITPSSASNKIMIFANVNAIGVNDGSIRLMRDSTQICIGDASSSRFRISSGINRGIYEALPSPIIFLDSPSTTSSITYKVQGNCDSAGTFYLNREVSDPDNSSAGRSASTITVMEIAG
jgi:hypothetical protein